MDVTERVEVGDVVNTTTMTGEFVVVAKDGEMTWLRDTDSLDLYTTTPEKLLTKVEERSFEVGGRYHYNNDTSLCFEVTEVNDITVLMKYVSTEGYTLSSHDWTANVQYYIPCDSHNSHDDNK